MADVLAELESGGSGKLRILAVGGDSQRVGRAADDLTVGGLGGIHDGEEGDGGVEAGVIDLTAVPGAVLIEGGLAGQEVGLDLVVAEGDAGGIEVLLVDHILEGVNSGGDGGIVPGSLAREDLAELFIADGLLNDGLEILGDAPGLLAGAAEGDDALGLESIAAGGQILEGLGDMIPADLGQLVHVGEEGDDVVGQRNRVMMSVIGGVLEHDLGQLSGKGLVSLVNAVSRAGFGKVAEEGAGPGEEDVGQGVGIAHGSLDLGLVGLVFKGFPLDLDVGMGGLKLRDGFLVGGTVGVALGGDAPHGQGDIFVCGELRGERGGNEGEDHAQGKRDCKNLFHDNPPDNKNVLRFRTVPPCSLSRGAGQACQKSSRVKRDRVIGSGIPTGLCGP